MKNLLATSVLTLGLVTSANAASLIFGAPSEVAMGEVFSVDIIVGDLADEALSAYEVEFTYDSNILQFNGYTLGNKYLGDNQLQLDEFGSEDFSIGNFDNSVNLTEVSYALDLTGQLNDFVLGSVEFTAVQSGINTFSFNITDLSNADGTAAINAYSEDYDVKVVPVPAAAWLMGSALLGLAGFSRKRA